MSQIDVNVWMPLYIGEHTVRTQRLTAEQHGAYLWLLMDYWSNGAPPADDAVLARIARLERPIWNRHKPVLLEFFTEVEGKLLHARLEELKGEAESNRSAVSARGTKAAQARWDKHAKGPGQATRQAPASQRTQAGTPACMGNAQAMLEQCPSPSPLPTPSKQQRLSDGFSSLETSSAPSYATDTTAPGGKPFISLPTNTGEMFHVDPAYVERLQGQYQALDVKQQLRQMQAWLESNRRNRKTTSGMTRFIANWLSRSQDRAPRLNGSSNLPAPSFLGDGDVM